MHKHFKRLHRREDWSHGLCHVTGSKGHDDPGSGLSLVTNSVQLELWAANLSQPQSLYLQNKGVGLREWFRWPRFLLLTFCSHLSTQPPFHLLLSFSGSFGLGTRPPRATSPGLSCWAYVGFSQWEALVGGLCPSGSPLHTSGFPGNGGAVASLSLQPHEW